MSRAEDLTGRRFGNLKAIKNTGKKYQTGYIWEFECLLCGKTVTYPAKSVKSGQCTSCGCGKMKNLKTMNTAVKVGQVGGTNVSRLLSDKLPKNNTSGHVGVSLQRRKNKSDVYVAYIYFCGVNYYLGRYKKIEDAIKARERAEEELREDFLTWYAKEYPERWDKINKNHEK